MAAEILRLRGAAPATETNKGRTKVWSQPIPVEPASFRPASGNLDSKPASNEYKGGAVLFTVNPPAMGFYPEPRPLVDPAVTVIKEAKKDRFQFPKFYYGEFSRPMTKILKFFGVPFHHNPRKPFVVTNDNAPLFFGRSRNPKAREQAQLAAITETKTTETTGAIQQTADITLEKAAAVTTRPAAPRPEVGIANKIASDEVVHFAFSLEETANRKAASLFNEIFQDELTQRLSEGIEDNADLRKTIRGDVITYFKKLTITETKHLHPNLTKALLKEAFHQEKMDKPAVSPAMRDGISKLEKLIVEAKAARKQPEQIIDADQIMAGEMYANQFANVFDKLSVEEPELSVAELQKLATFETANMILDQLRKNPLEAKTNYGVNVALLVSRKLGRYITNSIDIKEIIADRKQKKAALLSS